MHSFKFKILVGILMCAHSIPLYPQSIMDDCSIKLGASAKSRITTLQTKQFTPYYNLWNTHISPTVGIQYQLNNKLNLDLTYSKTKISNVYKIDKGDPSFFHDDVKSNKVLDVLYWQTNDMQLYMNYPVYKTDRLTLDVAAGAGVVFGQLNLGNYPFKDLKLSSDTLRQNITWQNGRDAEIIYRFYQVSVRDVGISALSGVHLKYKVGKQIELFVRSTLMLGLTPVVSSYVDYEIKDEFATAIYLGYDALSSNSGFDNEFGIVYKLGR
jgi:hypothetical protein